MIWRNQFEGNWELTKKLLGVRLRERGRRRVRSEGTLPNLVFVLVLLLVLDIGIFEILIVFYPDTKIKIWGVVGQFVAPHDFGPTNVVMGRIRGIFDTNKNIGAYCRLEVWFKIHSGSAVVVHPTFIVLTWRIILNHDRCFVLKPGCLSIFRIQFHIELSVFADPSPPFTHKACRIGGYKIYIINTTSCV